MVIFKWNLFEGNNKNIIINAFIRHFMRGKPPGIAKTLEQKLAESNYKDPSVHFHVDIGFPRKQISLSAQLKSRLQHIKANRKNSHLEKLAREKKLCINLNDARADWLTSNGPYQIKQIASHYGVFEHLFGDAYFMPRTALDIRYECGDSFHPVYFGNVLKPSDATKQPLVRYESSDEALWTLVLTNPDGHLTLKDSEYLHWFVGNIPSNNIAKGEVIVDYLQPFPPKGTGYHRYIYILYKQTKPLDYSSLKKSVPCLNLSERTFSTLNFYKENQANLTPAGLAFFQSDWDRSLTDFFHNTLNMREPIFEYDFPPPYIRPQKWFPLRQPFNLYMDKYKDPKDVSARYFKDKLKDVHPFQPPKPPLPFPNAEPLPRHAPSWLKLEMRKKRLGWGRVNDV